MEKVCSSKRDAAFLRHLQSLLYTIIKKTQKTRHLTEGTVASEVGLILQRSIRHDQTLVIGYGRSRVALGRSNSFKLQQTPTFK